MRSFLGAVVVSCLAACSISSPDDTVSAPGRPPAPAPSGPTENPGQPGTPSVDTELGPRGTVGGGLSFTCAWREDGVVYCWGSNESGQLGAYPDSERHEDAGIVPGLGLAVQVALGDAHACARHADGTVTCWGSNEYAETGRPPSPFELPQRVAGVNDAKGLAAGVSTSCVIRADDTVWCWGADEPEIRQIAGLANVVDIAAGLQLGCALDASGAVSCWPTATGEPSPVQGLPPARSITSRLYRSCAVTVEGALYCWELGKPATLVDEGPLQSAAVGYDSVCGLDSHRRMTCQGESAPETVAGPFQSLGAGGRHFCALHEDGVHVICDGANGYGQAANQILPSASP